MSVDYTILTASTVTALISLVNRRIADGWIPQGGVGVYGMMFCQAMIKKEATPKKQGGRGETSSRTRRNKQPSLNG